MTMEGRKFPVEKEGYDVTLVDFYIDTLSEAYELEYEEHQSLQVKYNNLSSEYTKLRDKIRSESSVKTVAKTLADIDILAEELMEEARAEAAKLKDEALSVIDDAYSKAAIITDNARKAEARANDALISAIDEAQMIIDEANAKAADIVEKSRQTVSEAWKIIRTTAKQINELLSRDIDRQEYPRLLTSDDDARIVA